MAIEIESTTEKKANLQSEKADSFWSPKLRGQEMQLGNWNLNELKLGIEAKQVNKEGDGAVEVSFGTTLSNKSLRKLAHLGFHAHPTKTPTITAIQSGAINIKRSPDISKIVDLLKIPNKAESKAIGW